MKLFVAPRFSTVRFDSIVVCLFLLFHYSYRMSICAFFGGLMHQNKTFNMKQVETEEQRRKFAYLSILKKN